MQVLEKRREQRRRDLARLIDLVIAEKALKLSHITLISRDRMPRKPTRDPQVIAISRNKRLQWKRIRVVRHEPRRITTLQQCPHR